MIEYLRIATVRAAGSGSRQPANQYYKDILKTGAAKRIQ